MERVGEIMANSRCGYLASSIDGQPRVRPMSFVLTAGNRLWSSTYDVSGKIKELEQNQQVELCFMDKDWVQLRIEGKVDLSGGPEKKSALLKLNPKVGNHFADENDPKFVHIELIPSRIRYKAAGFGEYTEVEL